MNDRAEPRWLDDDERTAWLALVGVLLRLPMQLDRQLQRDSGITHFEYQVIAGLSEAPDRTLRMSTLATFTESSLPRLSQVVRRLEDRGLVRRVADPSDGRYTLATLTADGWDVLVDAAPGHVEAVRSLVFDPLTKAQRGQLAAVCSRILSSIERPPQLGVLADHSP